MVFSNQDAIKREINKTGSWENPIVLETLAYIDKL
jgi:hypothetical protein